MEREGQSALLDRGDCGSHTKPTRVKKTQICAAGIIVVSLISAAMAALLAPSDVQTNPEPRQDIGVMGNSHPPIAIDGDAEFASQASSENWTGNGTEFNPYIIESLDIDASTANGISIQYTTVYFVIRYCNLYGGGISHNGIALRCSHGLVENNTCSTNMDGIRLDYSENVTVRNNTCNGNLFDVYLFFSDNNVLSENNCSGSGDYGIYLDTSGGNLVSGNTCHGKANYGIQVRYSGNNVVRNNTSYDNFDGIRLDSSNGNQVYGNVCSNNSWSGISILSASYNRVWNNTLYHNKGSGDSYDESHIQAYDSGSNNSWNGTDGYGNWWSDWITPDIVPPIGIVDSPYHIGGSAEANDSSPLTIPGVVLVPEYPELLIPIIGLTLIALLFGNMRNRRRPRKRKAV